jgi:heterodisulfide reductase subunit A
VEVLKHPRYVNMDRCIACGTCAEKCPKKVDDPFNQGLATRKAVYVDYAQAVPLKYAIDKDNCIYFQKGKCRACEKFCPTKAINFEDKEERITLKAGAVVLAPGFTPFNPKVFETYRYSVFPNVVTSMEFERILSATGPYQGHLVRPSDKKEPKKIAWLQCIGSRDINRCDHPYCSSVCCMYAIKEALIAKEHSDHSLDTAIFFMDMRTYGKDFERYYDRAREERSVRFIRSRIHSIEEDPASKDLILSYADEGGQPVTEAFDMVVLSVGLEAQGGVAQLAERLGCSLNSDKFIATGIFSPVETSRPGIFVCGAAQEPKDIPYSVMEASAAACEAKASLAGARGSLSRQKTYPQERDVKDEEARIGVFVCNCGTNIGGIVNVPEVAAYARTLPGVAYVEENLFTCSQDTQDKMKEVILKEKLNRVVVAACTPRTHEPLFQETLRDAGLNKYLFEMANIRNQCSWVHSKEKDEATEKAKDLVRMAVARAQLIRPLPQPCISVNDKALVIGGGVAGMAAALGLAGQGYRTYLVEKEQELGGNALKLTTSWQGDDIPSTVSGLIKDVKANPFIEVHTGARVKEARGFVGNFETVIAKGGEEITLSHGAVVIATGARELSPSEYLYGKDKRVMTHLELDETLRSDSGSLSGIKSAVFIQCVGSREPGRPYCSKVCCTHTMKSALELKERFPSMDIYILYRDIRTYGRREELYREARKRGVIFIRYDLEEKPRVEQAGERLKVTVKDHVLGRDIEISADMIALASAIVPAENHELATMYKLSLNEDGFFMEAHAKLRPVEFATEGIFVAGMSHYPKPIEESIAQAKAAASRASVVLSKKELTVEGVVSHINEIMCRGCGRCVEVCPYNAVSLVEREGGRTVAFVQEALCKGCGSCAVACPTGAADIFHFDDKEVLTMVRAALSPIG